MIDRFLSYGHHMYWSKQDCVLCVLHVLCESLVSPDTGGEQKLVVWSWSDVRVIT
jgi:hypothetical protein